MNLFGPNSWDMTRKRITTCSNLKYRGHNLFQTFDNLLWLTTPNDQQENEGHWVTGRGQDHIDFSLGFLQQKFLTQPAPLTAYLMKDRINVFNEVFILQNQAYVRRWPKAGLIFRELYKYPLFRNNYKKSNQNSVKKLYS